jgi:putative aldouronate transport system substrate-binding protein
MRKLVKALSLATVLVLVAGMAMAGCATPKPAPTAAPVATPEPAIDTSQEVHLYGYLLGAALPGMQDVMDALNEKLKADINATMEVNYIGWGDLQAKYPLILAAGENVDWIYTAAWCQYPTQAAKGAFMEMTPEIYAKYMPLHWAKLKDTSALKECSIDGKDYMIPTATPDKKVPVALYRKDLADKYGIPAITKFSDIEPYLAAIKANEPDMIPMNLDNTYDLGTPDGNLVTESSDIYTDILMITGSGCGLVYKPFGTDGKLMLPTDPDLLPVYTKAAKTVKSWYDAGYINHDAFANKVRSKEALVQGKTAVAFGNSIDVQGNLTQCAAAGMDIGIIPILSGANGKSPANAFTNNGIAISAKSKNWERALMAMDLVMEDPAYDNLCYYGVEVRRQDRLSGYHRPERVSHRPGRVLVRQQGPLQTADHVDARLHRAAGPAARHAADRPARRVLREHRQHKDRGGQLQPGARAVQQPDCAGRGRGCGCRVRRAWPEAEGRRRGED